MKRTIVTILSVLMVCFAPLKAQITPTKGTIYLMCNALTTSYTYTQLRGDIAGCLSEAGYTMVYNADQADWSIQIYGVTGKKKETSFGTTTWYFTEVTASLYIDRGAFKERVYENNLTLKGSYNTDYDDAALDAYRRLTPQICETILHQISQ
jgi:hypothetical protein